MSEELVEPTEGKEDVARVKGGRFAPGHKRLGGRRPGARNKFTWSARQAAQEAGFDPVALAMRVILQGKLPPIKGQAEEKVGMEGRLAMLKEIMQYMLPKLSATQITGKDEGPVAIATLDVTRLMEDSEMLEAAQRIALGLAQQRPQIAAGPPDPNEGDEQGHHNSFPYEESTHPKRR
jgi:hypothetical protein